MWAVGDGASTLVGPPTSTRTRPPQICLMGPHCKARRAGASLSSGLCVFQLLMMPALLLLVSRSRVLAGGPGFAAVVSSVVGWFLDQTEMGEGLGPRRSAPVLRPAHVAAFRCKVPKLRLKAVVLSRFGK